MVDQLLHYAKILALLGVANGTPIIAKKLLGARFASPLDGGLRWFDGRSIFGESKTVRGIVLSIAMTALVAPLAGLDMIIGAGLASASLIGDLFSSFTKRRLGLKPHSQAPFLDQIPECLLPLLLLRGPLSITVLDMVILVVLFIVLELVLSRILFRLRIRDRPY